MRVPQAVVGAWELFSPETLLVVAGHPHTAIPWEEDGVSQPSTFFLKASLPQALLWGILAFPLCLRQGSPRDIAVEGNIVRGAISKDPLSFHLSLHKMECHVALPQGYLVWPILGTEARSPARPRV